ncbi:acyltransferase family protein [Psychrobacter lutiphocae]|uniref:acyltransferase family protein n=1 Tax=Psychrobacter lutiphocae TaxID=540500 RepID=UPI00036F7EE1|nr:acyltransferase family protein [Psychrobacter lutiphocae]
MKFRTDINGLRAVAVIAVVLFHFHAAWMPGGFAGVDVFFVISGFLMTGIIFRGFENNNFSLAQFYLARTNRIIPALAALCFVMMLFGWFYLMPLDYKALGKHALSSVAFISNFIYLNESGYFAADSHEKWLLHTWSLSVEWQFYLLYPLVLMALHRLFSLEKLKVVLIFSALLSFVVGIWTSINAPEAAYFLLFPRAWEMMVGGIAYVYPLKLGQGKKRYLEALGLLMIVGSYAFISAEDAWPGYLALFPVLGTYLVIQAQNDSSFITGNAVFQKLGAWSYSIYLWHWPIVVAIFYFAWPSYYAYPGMLLSVLLGYLSYKYIERFKFRRDYSRLIEIVKIKPLYLALAMIIVGRVVYKTDGFDTQIRAGATSEKAQFLNHYANEHRQLDEAYWLKCDTYDALDNRGTYETDPSCVTKQGDGGVFLWGDSHAEALSLGLRQLLQPQDIPFYQKTSAGCSPSLTAMEGSASIAKQACDYSNKLAIASIGEVNPTLVVMTQAKNHDTQDWISISNKIQQISDATVVVVGPVPQWEPSLPKVMTKPRHWKKDERMIVDEGLDLKVIATEQAMMKKQPTEEYHYLSLVQDLCTVAEGVYACRVRGYDDTLLQVDYGHLSQQGSIYVVNEVLGQPILDLYQAAVH